MKARLAPLPLIASLFVILNGLASAAPGALDSSFGRHGFVVTNLGGGDLAKAIVAKDRIVVAGQTRRSGQLELARYGRNGALDPTFGSKGKLRRDLGVSVDVFDVAVDASGRILVLADTSGIDAHLLLLRFTGEGQPDTSFGQAGRAEEPTLYGLALAVGLDGKILVTGGGSSRGFTTARFTMTGELDSTFGGDGIVFTHFSGTFGASDVMVQRDGRVVVMGTGGSGSCYCDIEVARYLPDGTLDQSFGTGGKAEVGSTDGGSVGGDLDLNENIVLAGGDYLKRLHPNGTLDRSFGREGYTETYPSQSWGQVAVEDDGEIVVLFNSGVGAYTSVGKRDRRFGDAGLAPPPPTKTQSTLSALAIQSNGRILVTGSTKADNWVIARYLRP